MEILNNYLFRQQVLKNIRLTILLFYFLAIHVPLSEMAKSIIKSFFST
ncbi:hypothetical Protein YC6258_01477 [Gynuella sunshinyii YC6258]|uniref:Uncharacterized protein n=1 Tax=Gynuella sunshinyii YC6258 TaxID=1445510 RepID=A0A0C5V1U3_9GAMM|nr:hypothetical Protein YC6258_01477 [Gynuella sunshinyii YC6258]